MEKLFITLLMFSFLMGGIVLLSFYTENSNSDLSYVAEPLSLKPKKLNQNDLLPDLVPLPPADLKIQKENGETFLLFSTTYYNKGLGPVELRIDEESAKIRKDKEQQVFQRIYLKTGDFRDKLVGIFLWHQEHLHYHFSDFVSYDLTSVTDSSLESLKGDRVKATFCLRDVSTVELPLKNRAKEAEYLICGKKLQGVSVGWADTYFYNYPDQRLNISDLPSGIYRLSFLVNPESMLEEISLENNMSDAVFELNMEEDYINILEKNPRNAPKVEHVYLEQPFGL